MLVISNIILLLMIKSSKSSFQEVFQENFRCRIIVIYSSNFSVSLMIELMVELNDSYWRRQWHPTPVLLPRESYGWRSLEGCSPWGRWGSDTTEWLHFHFSLSCIGEGNGNPPQGSCLENLRDGGAWWAAVYGVAQSQTRLTRLSSSSVSMGMSLKCFSLKSQLLHLCSRG